MLVHSAYGGTSVNNVSARGHIREENVAENLRRKEKEKIGPKIEKRGMDENVGRRRAAAPMIGEMFLLLFIIIYLVF